MRAPQLGAFAAVVKRRRLRATPLVAVRRLPSPLTRQFSHRADRLPARQPFCPSRLRHACACLPGLLPRPPSPSCSARHRLVSTAACYVVHLQIALSRSPAQPDCARRFPRFSPFVRLIALTPENRALRSICCFSYFCFSRLPFPSCFCKSDLRVIVVPPSARFAAAAHRLEACYTVSPYYCVD